MFRRVPFLTFLVASIFVGLQLIYVAGMRADIVITSVSRGVGAAATGAPPDFDSTTATGFYSKDVSSIGSSLAGDIGSGAHQSSSTPFFVGPFFGGIGAADTFAFATGADGFSNYADSFFDVFFDVTTTGFYKLDGSVTWSSDSPPYFGFSAIELWDDGGGFMIDSVAATPGSPGTHFISGMYFLLAGGHYHISAETEITGGFASPGAFTAHGDWSFTFGVPEPSSFSLLAAGAAVLFAGQRFKRRRGR